MRDNATTARWRTGIALLLVGALVVGSVGPALAAPRVFVASAGIGETATVPGDPVSVNFQLQNTGDDGAETVKIYANGSEVFSGRYQVDSGGARNVTEQIAFDEPRTYRITVKDKRAGTVRVRQTVAETIEVRPDGRSMAIRGGRITYDTVVTTTFPSINESVAIESLTYRTLRNEFNRPVELYTDPANSSLTVPTGQGTTIFGAATISSTTGIEDQRIRIGVNQSRVDSGPVSSGNVTIYRASDGNYTALETTEVGTEDGRYVFEAQTNDTTTLLVGSLAPSFAVSDYSLSTSEAGNEKRIVVNATVSNAGSVAGTYAGSLKLDGSEVSTETIRLKPGETRSFSVSERVSGDGSYSVSLDNRFVGTVVVSTGGETETTTDTVTPENDQTETDDTASTVSDEPETETSGSTESETGTDATETGTDATETGTDAPDSDGGGFNLPNVSVPDANVGLTEMAIGGSVAVIGVILVLLRRW